MKKFAYIYTHNKGNAKDIKTEDLYEGERVAYKTEEVKYEDE